MTFYTGCVALLLPLKNYFYLFILTRGNTVQ